MEQRELSWRERGRLWMRIGIRTLLIVAILFLLYQLVPPLWSLFAPFVLAFIMAWLLNPLIRGIQKRLNISRGFLSLLLILLLFCALGGMVFAFVWSVISEIQSLIDNWSDVWDVFTGYITYLQSWIDGWFDVLPPELVAALNTSINDLLAWLKSAAVSFTGNFPLQATSFVSAVPPFAVASIIFVMGTYFITSDYPRLRFMFTEHLSPELRSFLSRVKATAAGAFGGYVKAEFILSIGVFFILLIGFLITHQNYGILLAAFLAVLDFIPIIGAGTVMVPWAVVCLFTQDFRSAIELMVIWGIIVLFRRLAEPKVVGNQTGLSPILSLVSIYVGMQVAGVIGMVLGPVVTLVLINIIKMGTFSPFLTDLKLAVNDCTMFLKRTPKQEPPDSTA